jgi:iron(III) transport system ATP-binding protein
MRVELRSILKSIQATAILVTHDQEEAMYVGDRIAVVNQGKLEQIGTPEEIFHQPATRFVAEFMGETNFLPGEVASRGIATELGVFHQKVDFPNGTKVELALRPDDVQFELKPDGESRVLARNFRGPTNVYVLQLPSGHELQAMENHTHIIQPGTPVVVTINPGHDLAVFPVNNLNH